VSDPKKINQTIDRFEYLLIDQTSPIISNLTHMLDYYDGRDLPPFEEIYSDTSDQSSKMKDRLSKFVFQGEQMTKLMENLDHMMSGMAHMTRVIDQETKMAQSENEQALQYYKQWTKAKGEKMGE